MLPMSGQGWCFCAQRLADGKMAILLYKEHCYRLKCPESSCVQNSIFKTICRGNQVDSREACLWEAPGARCG